MFPATANYFHYSNYFNYFQYSNYFNYVSRAFKMFQAAGNANTLGKRLRIPTGFIRSWEQFFFPGLANIFTAAGNTNNIGNQTWPLKAALKFRRNYVSRAFRIYCREALLDFLAEASLLERRRLAEVFSEWDKPSKKRRKCAGVKRNRFNFGPWF